MWSGDVRINSAPLVCRSCLATGVKLYDIHENRLVENYVQLIGISLQDRHSQQLCSVCSTLLLKFSVFRERCRNAYRMLIDADLQGKCIITYLEEIDIYTYGRLLKLPYVQSETQTYEYFQTDNNKIEALDLKHEIFIDDSCVIKKEDSDLEREDITVAFVREEFIEKKKAKVKMKYKKQIKKEDSGEEDRSATQELDKLNKNKKAKIKHKKKAIKNKSPTTKEEIIEYAKSFEFDVKFLNKEEQYAEIEEKKKQKSKRAGTQCEYCGKNFTNQEKLSAHYDRDHDPNIGSFVCKICHCRFPYSSRLLRHLQTHKVTFQCQICSATTKRHDTLQYHYLSHQGKKHTCQYCQKVFGKITTYFSHVRLVHASELPWCELCGESFINERGIKFHKSRVHKSEIAKLACDDCSCKFSTQEALDRHTVLKRCDLINCARCGEGFPTAQLLKYHLVQRHRTNMPLYDCEACGVGFLNLSARRRHGADCGAPACVQCGLPCDSHELVRDHARAHHAGETFKCEECDKTFSNAFYYRDHFVRMHRERDGQVRRGRGGVRAGRRPRGEERRGEAGEGGGEAGEARGEAGEGGEAMPRAWRPHGPRGVVSVPAHARPPATTNAVCEVCGKAFQCVARLSAHLATHSAERSHACELCRKAFRTAAALECHRRVHTGERPFRCALCPKAFKMQPGLLRHQLVHSGVRRHECQVCRKRFQTSSSVKLHIRSVHMRLPAPARARRNKQQATTG